VKSAVKGGVIQLANLC